ncbi:zinc-binding dehydrogenase [Streptomyces sp. NPDC055082]|uniref:zinc-binding dehydrogenase n=1 Tax=Streptomyces sp. NPDC055082 TaxID=3365718 RepID=UPI0037D2E645
MTEVINQNAAQNTNWCGGNCNGVVDIGCFPAYLGHRQPRTGHREFAAPGTGFRAEQAAAPRMAAETAWRALDDLGVQPGELLLVHGAGSTVGEVAVRLALHRGVRVIAHCRAGAGRRPGETGARVSGYGDGMADRVAAPAGGRVDRALDTAPTGGRIDRADQPSPGGGSLPSLIELTGDPDRVLTVSDFAAAAELGTRITQIEMRYVRMSEFARLADEGILVVSVARTYTLDQIQEAAKLSQSRRPGGKLMLVL